MRTADESRVAWRVHRREGGCFSVTFDQGLAQGHGMVAVRGHRYGLARPRVEPIHQWRIQPPWRRIHVRLLGPEPSDAGHQQRRVQSAVKCGRRLCHWLTWGSGRFPRLIVAGASRLSGGTAARRDIHPAAACLCRRLHLAKRRAAPAIDMGRRGAVGESGKKAGVTGFGTVDGGGIVGGAEFPVVA
jgi:hypothetical protein